jgi:hypothetical protein
MPMPTLFAFLTCHFEETPAAKLSEGARTASEKVDRFVSGNPKGTFAVDQHCPHSLPAEILGTSGILPMVSIEQNKPLTGATPNSTVNILSKTVHIKMRIFE